MKNQRFKNSRKSYQEETDKNIWNVKRKKTVLKFCVLREMRYYIQEVKIAIKKNRKQENGLGD